MRTIKKKHIILSLAIILVLSFSSLLVYTVTTNNNTSNIVLAVNQSQIVTVSVDDKRDLIVYATQDNKLIAQTLNGDILWELKDTTSPFYDRINNIKIGIDNVYISLVNKRHILALNINNGSISKAFKVNDSISLFSVDEDEGFLTVVGIHNNINYLTVYSLNEPTAQYNTEYDENNITPYLKELEYHSRVVGIVYKDNKIYYGLRNGTIYSLSQNNMNGNPSIYVSTGLTLRYFNLFDDDILIALSEKAIIKKYIKNTETSVKSLNKDVLVATGNDKYILIALKMDKTLFYNALQGEVEYTYKTFNETSFATISENLLFLREGHSNKTMFIDFTKIGTLKTFQILTPYILIFTLLSCLFFVYALLNFLEKTREKQIRFFKTVASGFWKNKKCYFFLLPTFILLGIFNYFPAIWGFSLAFTDYVPGVRSRFVGFANFVSMFQNEYFFVGIGNMLLFLVTDLIKVLVPPLIIAEIIYAIRSKRTQYWLRVSMYIPGILPGVAGLMIWTSGIFGMEGLMNLFLNGVGMGHLVTDWLGNTSTAIWALIFIGFPFIGGYLLFYGSIMGVPDSLFEAAKIDGCTWVKRILFIDIPMISPQLKFVFVTGFIGSVQDFARIWLTTQGGPGRATYTPALELYLNISTFNNYGVAAAMGLTLFIFIFGITLLNLKIKTNASFD